MFISVVNKNHSPLLQSFLLVFIFFLQMCSCPSCILGELSWWRGYAFSGKCQTLFWEFSSMSLSSYFSAMDLAKSPMDLARLTGCLITVAHYHPNNGDFNFCKGYIKRRPQTTIG